MIKFIKSGKFGKLILKNYQNNKFKWRSRDTTRNLLLMGKIKLNNKCEHLENLEIHHEIYPTKREEIINAARENKIYILCRDCHRKL